MKFFDAIRLSAMAAVLKPDDIYWQRHIFRWYSETFNVPLPEVEAIDPLHVLQTFFERRYEDLRDNKPEQLHDEMAELLETPEEAIERDRRWHATEVESLKFRKWTEAEEKKKYTEALKLKDEGTRKAPEITRFQNVRRPAAETTLPEYKPKPKEALPEISDFRVNYVTADTLEAELGGSSIGIPPAQSKPKK